MEYTPNTASVRARYLAASGFATIGLAFISPDGLSAAQAQRFPAAHESRVLNVTDTAHLKRRNVGTQLLEEGQASGALPGAVKVSFELEGPSVKAHFTITTRYGSLTGYGSGTLHSSGLYASFGGSMTVTRGTGRYSKAHGHGGFYGVINRHSYEATVQTTGSLHY